MKTVSLFHFLALAWASAFLFACSAVRQPTSARPAEEKLTYVAEVVRGAARITFPSSKDKKSQAPSIRTTHSYIRTDPGTRVECIAEDTKVIIWGGPSPYVLQTGKGTRAYAEFVIPRPGDPASYSIAALNVVAAAFRTATSPLGRDRAQAILVWPDAEREVSIGTLAVRWNSRMVKGKQITLSLKRNGLRIWSIPGLNASDEVYESASLRETLHQHPAGTAFTLELTSNGGTTAAAPFRVFSTEHEQTLQTKLKSLTSWTGIMLHIYKAQTFFESGLYPEAADEYAEAHSYEPDSILVARCEQKVRQLYSGEPAASLPELSVSDRAGEPSPEGKTP